MLVAMRRASSSSDLCSVPVASFTTRLPGMRSKALVIKSVANWSHPDAEDVTLL